MAFEHLDALQISGRGRLKLNPDSISRTAKTDSAGEDEHWSAKGLYRHLCLLEGLVPRTGGAAARLWINAFFFRVATMWHGDSKIVLNVEQNVLPAAANSTSPNYWPGSVNFTAISITEANAESFLENPILTTLSEQDRAFVVSEAKEPDQRLPSHLPQAICEMYACARQLRKTTIRGVLTSGHNWIFLILELNEDGNGGKYIHSDEIPLINWTLEDGKYVSEAACSLIAGILAHWIRYSHNRIGDGDYFTTKST